MPAVFKLLLAISMALLLVGSHVAAQNCGLAEAERIAMSFWYRMSLAAHKQNKKDLEDLFSNSFTFDHCDNKTMTKDAMVAYLMESGLSLEFSIKLDWAVLMYFGKVTMACTFKNAYERLEGIVYLELQNLDNHFVAISGSKYDCI